MTCQAIKRQQAQKHNERYVAEKERIAAMSKDERLREIIRKSVREAASQMVKELGI